jgi:hypothetical protein
VPEVLAESTLQHLPNTLATAACQLCMTRPTLTLGHSHNHAILLLPLLLLLLLLLRQDPYFNEPNVERMRGTSEGNISSMRLGTNSTFRKNEQTHCSI